MIDLLKIAAGILAPGAFLFAVMLLAFWPAIQGRKENQ